jgi:hypothetical protein
MGLSEAIPIINKAENRAIGFASAQPILQASFANMLQA